MSITTRVEEYVIGQSKEVSGPQKKSRLLAAIASVQMEIRELDSLLKTSTPQAANLLVTKDIEKLLRSAEKVQMGLQSLVL